MDWTSLLPPILRFKSKHNYKLSWLNHFVKIETERSSRTKIFKKCHVYTYIRDFTQSGLGDRTTPPITSFDHHVFSEEVALFNPYANDKDVGPNIPRALSNSGQAQTQLMASGLYYNMEQNFRI